MTSEAPSKDTRSRIDVLVEYLNGADRVVIETKNALGEMDAGYLHAPAVLHGLATLTAENAALKSERDVAVRCALMRRDWLDEAEATMKKMRENMAHNREVYTAALKARVEALERALRFIGCSENAEGKLARAALSPEKEG